MNYLILFWRAVVEVWRFLIPALLCFIGGVILVSSYAIDEQWIRLVAGIAYGGCWGLSLSFAADRARIDGYREVLKVLSEAVKTLKEGE